MADKEAPHKFDDVDMSIDELSAAIDAHMTEISTKKKPSAKKADNEPAKTDEAEPAEAKTEEKVPEKEDKKEETVEKADKKEAEEDKDDDSTQIEVKRSYVSKAEDTDSSLPTEEKGKITQTSKVDLKPLNKSSASSRKADEAKAEESTKVDVVVKKKEESKETTKEEEKSEEPEPEPEEKEEEPKTAEKTEVTEETKTEPETEKEKEDKPEAKQESEEKEVEPAATDTNAAKSTNDIDQLVAQTPQPKEENEEEQPDTLRTFDTKKYHIPIKPSRHHRRSGSFLLFIAVFAAILAVVYVLNELEVIDIAQLISSY